MKNRIITISNDEMTLLNDGALTCPSCKQRNFTYLFSTYNSQQQVAIGCLNCHKYGKFGDTPLTAIKRWNIEVNGYNS